MTVSRSGATSPFISGTGGRREDLRRLWCRLPTCTAHLLAAREGADVTFQVAGEAFRAHRCILAARSPVFKAELFGAMKESTSTGACIRIGDMLPQVFNAFAAFHIHRFTADRDGSRARSGPHGSAFVGSRGQVCHAEAEADL